jgi:hypothetical protein
MDIEVCDISSVDVSSILRKFQPAAAKEYDKTMFKALPEKIDPYSIITRDEVSISTLLKSTGDLRLPSTREALKPFAVSEIPKVQSRDQDLLLKIEICKNKIMFLETQHSLIDEYMGVALEMISKPSEFLSTIEYPEYVKSADNITTIQKNIKEFDKVVHDTKFYKSIERHVV